MEGEEGKISVWVCREEKLISGLSRRTTCADVVRVLLHQHQARGQPSVLSGSSDSYCLVEKWRGFERVLPHKSRILRLWTAWGSEQENVRFVLVKQDASLPNSSPRSAEARVVASKDKKKEGPGPACVYKGTARVTMAFSPEKQRRIVRKAFRKLEKINKKRAQALGGKQPSVEKMETLVHLIVSQDHTIRQQVQRIREIDREIHLYEARVHLDRVKAHGNNYVQDTYLEQQGLQARAGGLGGEQQQQQQQHLAPEVRAQLEEYTRRCEEVAKLQEELCGHEAQLDTVTMEITEELNRRWMERRKPEQQEEASSCRHRRRHPGSPGDDDGDSPPGASRLAPDTAPDSRGEEEEERIKTQLDASLYVGLRLATDLEAISGDLSCSGDLWSAREGELRDLLARVRALDLCADQEEEELSSAEAGGEREPWVTEPEPESAWLLEQARGLSKSKALEGDDDDDGDDSDTGLSSLHSQDSDSARMAAESLV
ncbi:ras association domain-containing protein 10 [Engraulis encrasicolus]|uniref:ras association domain-containing protein 10 n=1 Tax=Engraulis encrasicolus TaxID=184585 RepID=UPI002FD487A0